MPARTTRAPGKASEPTGAALDAKLNEAFGSETASFPTGPVGLPPRPADDPRMGIPEGWEMIHTLISRILADVGPVAKNERNLDQKYSFRGVDSVVNAINTAFKKHRVYPTSKVVNAAFQAVHTTGGKPSREVTGTIRFRFTAPDGTYIETEVLTEALDQSDKGGPKAMSVALRIALLQMLLLPTDEPTTDHEYQTRDGRGPMSASTAALVRYAVEDPRTRVELLGGELWAVVVEHAAWDRPAPHDQLERTWIQVFADRYAREISRVQTFDEGKALKTVIGAARALDWRSGDKTLDEHLAVRADELRRLFAETFNHVMEHVLAAAGQDELDAALGCMEAAIEARTLPAVARDKIAPVAGERRAKLPESAPIAEPPADISEARERGEEAARLAEVPPADPKKGQGLRLRAFALRAAEAPLVFRGSDVGAQEAEELVFAAISDLLTGQFSGDPASHYGDHGFTLVRDAITAAHRREHTIGADTRAQLDALLAECVAAYAQSRHKAEVDQETAEEQAAMGAQADADDEYQERYRADEIRSGD